MRSIFYILSLLLLTYSLKPCTDSATAILGKGEVVAVADLHQDHQDSSADECSPFCACHCCHTHYQLQSIAVIEDVPVPKASHEFALYKNIFISSSSCSIWQPPKVG
ncbi:DUF6660 family protein [Pontibacter sp. E15-1]|uniref:DUF6660 family protein n=1 Tax=Pontibacter sp. E15-1 TaxID=2919918 RepID=UPI00397B103B